MNPLFDYNAPLKAPKSDPKIFRGFALFGTRDPLIHPIERWIMLMKPFYSFSKFMKESK